MTTMRRARRRRFLATAAVTLAATAGGVMAVTQPATAQQRDPCADRAHKAQVALDTAHGWWVIGMTLDNIGFPDQADDAFAYQDYFFAEFEMYLNDPILVTGTIVWHHDLTGETQLWFMHQHQLVRRATIVGEDGQPALIGPPFRIVGAASAGMR